MDLIRATLIRSSTLFAIFFVGFVGALVLVFVPPVTLSSEHSWDVVRDEPVVTGLIRPDVESIAVVGSCGVGSGFTGEVLEADNWLVSVDGQDLEVVSPLGGSAVLGVVLPGSCEFEVTYSLSDMSVAVRVVDEFYGREILQESASVSQAFRLSSFSVSGVGKPVFDEVVVETFPWGLGFSPSRLVGQVLAFGAVGLLVLRTVLGDRASPRGGGLVEDFPRLGFRWSRWAVHGLVLVTLVAGVMMFPSYFDDGWVWHRYLEASQTGLVSEPYGEGIFLVQGIWSTWLFVRLIEAGASFEVLRLVVAGLLWWGWWFLTRSLERFGYIRHFTELVVAASVFVAFSLAHLMTIRPEPIVTTLVALFFVGFLGFVHRQREGSLLVAGLAAVAAVTTHQAGFVLLLPALLLLGFAVRQAWLGRNRLEGVVLPALVTILFGFGLACMDYAVPTLATEIGFSFQVEGYRASELQRWLSLLAEPGWRWWPLLVLGIAGVVALSGLGRLAWRDRLFVVAVLLTPLGLFFTVSKWTWHLGALAIPAVLLVVLAMPVARELLSRRSGLRVGLVPLLVGLVGVVAFVVLREGILNWTYPYRNLDQGGFLGLFVRFDAGTVGGLALTSAVLALVTHLLHGRWREIVSVGVVAVLVAVPVGNHYSMLVAESLVWQGWTPFKQRVMNLAGIENCGTLDEFDAVTGVRPISITTDARFSDTPGPFGLGAFAPDDTGTLITLEGDDGNGQMVVWAKGIDDENNVGIDVVDSLGVRHEASSRWFPDPGTWQLFLLPSGDWSGSRLTVTVSGEHQLPVLVTAPAIPQWRSAADLVSGTTILAGPGMSTYTSCAHEPINNEGRWVGIDYVLVTDMIGGQTLAADKVVGDKIEIGFREASSSFISLIEAN